MKTKSLKQYIDQLRSRCISKFDESFADDNADLIEATAKNKRLLDRFDEELASSDLSVIVVGSMGQSKSEINPIIKHRNDVAKLYADNLEALMLTPRAQYKKQEAVQQTKADDPTADYFRNIKQ